MNARADLSTLEGSGLIQIAALQPELEYMFRHALVQEAAYASLLKQDRRTLHRSAAETILALHPGSRGELAAVVGMHYELAGDAASAAEFLVVAGDHAFEHFANKEAVRFFRRASVLVAGANPNLELRAAIGGAKAGWTLMDSEVALQELDRAIAGAAGADQKLVAEGYFWLAFMRRQRGEVPESSPELKHALERAAEIGTTMNDPNAAALPKALMGSFIAFTGNLREGAKEMVEALPVLEAGGDAVSVAIVGDFLSLTYSRLGEFAAAEETIERARQFAGDGDAIARVDVDIAQSGLNLERGEAELASRQAHECSERAEGLGAYACVVASNVMFGAASLAKEDAISAKQPLERGNELSVVTNMAPMRTLLRALLGSTRMRLGDVSGGVADWDQALANARDMSDRYGEAQTLWGRGRTYARRPDADLPAALADLDRATQLFEAMGTRPALARALHDQAVVLRSLGRSEEAEAVDRRSQGLGHELGLRDMPFA